MELPKATMVACVKCGRKWHESRLYVDGLCPACVGDMSPEEKEARLRFIWERSLDADAETLRQEFDYEIVIVMRRPDGSWSKTARIDSDSPNQLEMAKELEEEAALLRELGKINE